MRSNKVLLFIVVFLLYFSTFLATQDIVNLAIPVKTKPKSGWKLDATVSESQLKLNWKDSSGKEYSAPIVFYNYPNGTFGAVTNIDNESKSLPCDANIIPIHEIQEKLYKDTVFEIVPDPPESFKGKYSLIDSLGSPSQILEIKNVGKDKEQLAFVYGTMHFVFPKGLPEGGVETLASNPGTRLILRSGLIIKGRELINGVLVVDILLKDINYEDDSGTERTIKNVLYYKVKIEGEQKPKIVSVKDSSNTNKSE